ncbi:hypothetical protein JCM19294_346 [Nonlabens tegetincola]|uniref:Uncharacterized protein n=1 Tax=Nonlabens tegetincola TaxID=323273 RepID=A0A090Q6I0_9FLAO|nr:MULTISPECIES: hypothetical protein [Nonlabens]ALM21395.1 secreted protein containing tetratricopeptide repeats [Nonlabens sp. MIC269]ARN71888.1 hypothetical protein BST91_09625 [Nonlabens tegetincola]PQJ20502.1 hypothetical protein BST93_03405 [Nonlabens tegetincola]GAK97807.1 hypothetical protein JCM19294_346 [Nonlabens tegetincola]
MKLKNTILFSLVVLGFAFAKAQSGDCNTMLSIYAENAKAKNYDEAYKQLGQLVQNCPDASPAIYQYGERIYEHRLKKKIGDQNENVKGLMNMLETQINKYADKINVTKKKVELGRVMYKYKQGTQSDQFNYLNETFTSGKEDFTDPNGLITYFKLAEKEYKANALNLEDLFNVYDALTEHLDNVSNERSKIVSELLDKEAEGTITEDEKKNIENQEKNLKNYGIVMKSVNGTIGSLADCDNLIPLYSKDFDANKSNMSWLKNVLGRLQKKDCTESDLYVNSVKALHELQPSAMTAYGLGNIAKTNAEKLKYWDEALSLGIDQKYVANIHYKKAELLRKQGSFGKAKREYILANQAKPSFGLPFLRIAGMVAQSTNSCGNTPFEKRAVNWIAARYANKAASVDPTLRSTAAKAAASYNGVAPSNQDIFLAGMAGKRITFSCWVGESVTVPTP